jgi:hypothetical protein
MARMPYNTNNQNFNSIQITSDDQRFARKTTGNLDEL